MAMEDIGNVPAVINGSGGDGYGGMGIIGLIAILALFGGGFGFGNNRDAAVATGVSNDLQLTTLSNNMESGFNRVTTQQNFDTLDMTLGNISHSIDAGNASNLMATKDAQYAQALIAKDAQIQLLQANCETNRNIDALGMQSASQTAAIIANQITLAKDAELRCAYQKIAEQSTALSEQRITSTILQSLQPPRPVPAYATANPYEQYVAPVRLVGNCGFNNGVV